MYQLRREGRRGKGEGSLGTDSGAHDLARLYRDVLPKRFSPEAAAAALTDAGARQLAYEMAVCVCDADGRQSEAEL